MAKKIAVVGISADPPTDAHALLAELAYESDDNYDEVWIMPCNDHMFGKKLAPKHHRLAMTALMVNDLRRLHKVKSINLSDFEIAHNLDGSTYTTLAALRHHYPKDEFHWVIGMDNANGIHNWARGKVLIETYPFRVVDRGGYPADPAVTWYRQAPHKVWTHDTVMNCASSEFRRLYLEGDPKAASFVLPSVYSYIQVAGLYKGGNS